MVEEVSYSPHSRTGDYNPRLDLVLFVNGIPTATLELKSEFKQTVEHAKRQYKKDRPVKDPVTRKPEPLPGRSGDDHAAEWKGHFLPAV